MPVLTAEQRLAVERRRGSLALTAGAGSGKTTVLVERFVRAVHEDGVAPARILAITFTERAAGELRERIRARLLELGRRDGAREAEVAFIGTFHGFCARLLRTHAVAAGLDPGFRVLDEGMADRLRLLALRDAVGELLDKGGEEAVDLAAAYGVGGLEAIVLNAHAALRSQGQSAPRLPLPAEAPLNADASAEGQDGAAVCALIDRLLAGFGERYGELKRSRSAVDFDDLELLARDLLREHPGVRAAWRERFEMVMVDELQDTNRRQAELLELLESENLFTVGDEMQAIYGFRHAEVALFRERRQRLEREGAALALTHNFRSRPAILAAVDRVFAARLGERHEPLVPARAGEPSSPVGEESAVELLLTDCRGWQAEGEPRGASPPSTPWRLAEARLVARRLAALVGEGTAPGEIAVLLRGLGDLPVYEAALQAAGLPTLAATGGFWGHRQVGGLLACLRALANQLDELSLYSTLASPLVGLSSDGLVLLARAARAHGCGAWQAVERHGEAVQLALPAADREPMRAFARWFSPARRAVGSTPLAQTLRQVVRSSGYDRHVLSLSQGERRLANIHKLMAIARTYESTEGRDLRGFLDHAEHLSESFSAREAHAPAGEHTAAIQLMSVHAAKGLEFPVVCVADLGRASRMRTPDLIVERDGRVGLRLRSLREPEGRPVLDHETLSAELRAAEEAEEERILYVAMTRARDRLLLSGAADFARWPAPREGGAPIAWLAPALLADLPALLDAGVASGEAREVAAGSATVRVTLNRAGDAPAEPSLAVRRSPGAQAPQLPLGLEEGWPTARRADGGEPPVDEPGGEPRQPPADSPAPIEALLADPDATVSYTSLAELERCGYRHYLERVVGLPEDVEAARRRFSERGIDPRVRGTLVHLLLERTRFGARGEISPREVSRLARASGMRVSPRESREVVELVEGALAAPLTRRLAAALDVRREHHFAFSLGARDPLVTGVLDLLARERDGTDLVVDYKTDEVLAEDDLEEIAERDYGLQRLLYGLAALERGAGQVEVVHWFLRRPQEAVSVVFGADERDALRARVTERLRELRAKGLAVSDRPHRALCLTCPGRAGLCSWSEGETLCERRPEDERRLATLTS